MAFFACVLVHVLLDTALKSVTALTSSCGWSIVRVENVMTSCWGFWFQYQLVSTYTEQIYCALTTNHFTSSVILSYSVYASDVKMTT